MTPWSHNITSWTRKIGMDVKDGGNETLLRAGKVVIAHIKGKHFNSREASISMGHDLGRAVAFLYGAAQSETPLGILIEAMNAAEQKYWADKAAES